MPRFTHLPRNEKEHKNITVYNILKKKGGVSRSDIAELTNINIVSISNYINSFIKTGLAIEKTTGKSSGGRPPVILDLNNDNFRVMGVHVSSSRISGVMIDASVKILNRAEKEISSDIKDAFLDLIGSLKGDADYNSIKGIAVVSEEPEFAGLDNAIKEDAIPIEGRKINIYKEKASIAAAYAQLLAIPEYFENKILYSHDDLGDCALLDDTSFYLSEDTSIEDYSYLKPWGANMSVKNHAIDIVERGVGTEIVHLSGEDTKNITADKVIEAARKNDNVALEILEFLGLSLGVRLAYLVNVFKPKNLILGGGVEKAGDYFLGPLKKSVERLSREEALSGLKIENSALGEDAVTVGAAALIVRELFMGV